MQSLTHSVVMKISKQITFLLLFSVFVSSVLGQTQIHEWTNKAGRTIKAKFVRGDEETVTIFANGRNYVLKLADLSPESQSLARKLSAPPKPKPKNPPKPDMPDPSDPPDKPPAPAGGKPVVPGGKNLLPTLGTGKWAQFHSVLETSTHDVALHGNGRFYLYLKDGEENLLQGRPLTLRFHHGYYSKPHPRGSTHAYYATRAEYNYYFRKVTGFKNLSKPSEKLGRMELQAQLEGGSTLEIGFEASSRRIAIWGEVDDPSSVDHPTVISLSINTPDSILINDNDGLAEWKPLVDDTAIDVVTTSGAKESIPYLEKWVDLRKKLTFSRGIQSAFASGKLFGRRKLTIGPKSLRNAYFTIGSYSGIFPLQHHFYHYRDRSGGKIDKSRRLEIEIK